MEARKGGRAYVKKPESGLGFGKPKAQNSNSSAKGNQAKKGQGPQAASNGGTKKANPKIEAANGNGSALKRSKDAQPPVVEKLPVAQAAKEEEQEEEEEASCLICCEPIDYFSVGECEHRFVCSQCTLRRRGLYKEMHCCICKQDLEKTIFSRSSTKPFRSLKLSGMFFDETSKCYFEDQSHFEQAQKLWKFACPVCDKECEHPLASLSNLKKHLKTHHMSYCDLCLQHRKIFLKEHKVYTPAALEKHEFGEGEKELDQHQWCEFCTRLFFDKDDIFQHLMKEHFTCHLCERNGIKYHYFKDYRSLERHFRRQHFICEDKGCLEKKFIVFGTALDLRAHDLKFHMQERGLTRAEMKQAQRLDIDLFYEKPPAAERKSRGREDPVVVFNPMLSHPPPRAPADGLGPTPAAAAAAAATAHTESNARNRAEQPRPKYVKKEQQAADAGKTEDGEKEAAEKATTPTVQFPPEPTNEEERRARNAALVIKIRSAIGEAEFPNFKQISVDLRQARLTPAQYYQKYLRLFGLYHGPVLFPELVSLLPDPVLRSQLTTIHRQAVAQGQVEANPKPEPPKPQEPPSQSREAPHAAPVARVPSSNGPGRGEREGGKPPQPTVRRPDGAWGTGPPLRAGGRGGRMTSEDFPSLPPSNYIDEDAELARLLQDKINQQSQTQKGKKKSKKGQVLLRFG